MASGLESRTTIWCVDCGSIFVPGLGGETTKLMDPEDAFTRETTWTWLFESRPNGAMDETCRLLLILESKVRLESAYISFKVLLDEVFDKLMSYLERCMIYLTYLWAGYRILNT